MVYLPLMKTVFAQGLTLVLFFQAFSFELDNVVRHERILAMLITTFLQYEIHTVDDRIAGFNDNERGLHGK